jgi:hypothetical protein
MRIAGTLLMLLGAFLLAAVTLSEFGFVMREGVAVGAVVTSVPATIVAGILALVAGAYLRRRAKARDAGGRPGAR